MRLTIKLGLILALISISFTGCKTSILNDEDNATSAKNVGVRIYSYWNNYYFNTDSLYFAGGAYLKIDEISIIHSGFTFVNDGDTMDPGDVAVWKITEGSQVMLSTMEIGSYSGFYYYYLGLDADINAKAPSEFPDGHPLANGNLYRGPNKGYNFVTITGRIQDPNKPGSEPDMPLKWVIATDDLLTTISQAKSFNVVAGKQVGYDVVFDVAKLFEGMFPLNTPIIKADPGDLNDYNQATVLHQNFKNEAYKIQF